MPAKKSTTIAATAAPAAMAQFQYPVAMPPMAQYPQFQYPQQPPMAQFQYPMPVPVAQTVSPIEVLESQIKAMKEYLSSMEKTLKEVKKSSKKSRTPKDPSAPPKQMSAGVKAWNEYKKYVREEESAKARAANPALGAEYMIPPKLAMEIASQRKTAGDPKWAEYQGGASAAQPSSLAAPAKAPKAAKAAPVLAPAPQPTFQQYSFPVAPAPVAAATEEEEEEECELEEVTINGKQYLFNPETSGCWLMNSDGTQGAWAGNYDGTSIDDSAEEE